MCEMQRLPRLTLQKKNSEKIKQSVYKNCVTSAMVYGSDTVCLGQNEIGLLQRKESAMARRMCEVKLMDKKFTKDPMEMLELTETIDQLARADSVRWYGHVLRKDKNNFLRRELDLKVKGKRKRGRPMKTWIKAVVEQSRKVWMKTSYANNLQDGDYGLILFLVR